jgi:hypothetical protein
MNFINRVNSTIYHRIHVVRSDLHKYIDKEKFLSSIEKYKDYDFNQNGIYCLTLVTKILEENGVMKPNNLLPYLLDDTIKPINYNVPVKFEEPV